MRRILFVVLFLAVALLGAGSDVAHAANCPPPQLFADPTAMQLGLFPVSVAKGDFDADGRLDLAITLLDENKVAVLMGNGDGSFQPQQKYAAGTLPRGVVAADFDHDGALDLAVTDVSDSSVNILKGRLIGGIPSGQFSAPVAYKAGWENRGVVATDLDGDSWIDLVVAGRTAAVVLKNLGDGTFARTAYLSTPGCWSVTAFRHPSTSRPVIVAANWTVSRLDVFVGADSAGSSFNALSPIALTAGCAEITAGDLNGDGFMDLVAPGAAGLRVLLGTSSAGGFGAPVSYESGGGQMNDAALLDMNADGALDIAATDTDLQNVVLLLNAGDGTFGGGYRLESWAGPNGIEAGDSDGDHLADLFVVHSGTQIAVPALFVWRGLCGLVLEPVLTDVRDVPHDQGGRVFVTWQASGLDRPSTRGILNYRVWRRILPPGTSARIATDFLTFVPGAHTVVARFAGATIEYWEPVAEVPAAFLEGYGYTAATTQDSIAGSYPYTAFFVQALTSDPFTFYSSAVDSGYSVDNLAPPTPEPFVVVYTAQGAALHWAPNAAGDFARFHLHRGAEPEFAPAADNLLAAQADTGYVDPSGSSQWYYKLAAVDVHGNVSPYALATPNGSTAALASLVTHEVRDGRVFLVWHVAADAPTTCTVQRRLESGWWKDLGIERLDGSGFVRFEDGDVVPGSRYGYRLAILEGAGAVQFAGESWIDLPSEIDLAPRVPNPVIGGDVTVSFATPMGHATRVELLDVSGRIVASRTIAGTGVRQVIGLARAHDLAPGLYLVRIGMDKPVVARVAVLR